MPSTILNAIIDILLIGTAAIFPATHSKTPDQPIAPPIQIVNVAEAAELPEPPHVFNSDDLKLLVDKYGDMWKISEKKKQEMLAVVTCETGGKLDPLIQSGSYASGIREDSWGLAQIHLPAHPDVTRAQAQDPDFAINFMAENFSYHRESMWSCWNILKADGKI